MEWAIAVCISVSIGSAIVCVICAKQANKSADRSVEFAEAAELDASASGKDRVSVKELAHAVGVACGNFDKARQEVVAACKAEVESAAGHAVLAETHCHTAAEVAEVVKVESAKVVTLIEQLKKVRADNPPILFVRHEAESGDAEAVVDAAEKVARDTGRFCFKPAQVNAVIREDSEV